MIFDRQCAVCGGPPLGAIGDNRAAKPGTEPIADMPDVCEHNPASLRWLTRRKKGIMKLAIHIQQDAEMHSYTAWCPALPGCQARANTQQEARQKIEQAVDGYLASLNVSRPQELHLVTA